MRDGEKGCRTISELEEDKNCLQERAVILEESPDKIIFIWIDYCEKKTILLLLSITSSDKSKYNI